jgi:hypothetical protein
LKQGILWCLIVAVVAVAVLVGALMLRGERREVPGSGADAGDTAHRSLTEEQELELERIATLGYVAGVEPLPERTGVLKHDPGRAFEGYTLYTGGEGAEAFLIDMNGHVVHRWSYPGAKGWPRARVLPDGDLLVITASPPSLLRLDIDSRLLWRFDGRAHHDFCVLPDGSICVLVRTMVRRPDLNGGEPVIGDNVVLLSDRGRQRASISLLKAFERSAFGERWTAEHPFPDGEDIFHTNSIRPLERNGRLQLLLSIRSTDTVAVLDVETGGIVWAMMGRWHRQHEAQIVDGNLLLFDNLGPSRENAGVEQSRVIELDLETRALVWSYAEPGFFTRRSGAQQRLPNGNTLITESEAGRVLEVDPDGRTVWEYVNPKAVEGSPHLLLGILRAERIPTDYVDGWELNGGA